MSEPVDRLTALLPETVLDAVRLAVPDDAQLGDPTHRDYDLAASVAVAVYIATLDHVMGQLQVATLPELEIDPPRGQWRPCLCRGADKLHQRHDPICGVAR